MLVLTMVRDCTEPLLRLQRMLLRTVCSVWGANATPTASLQVAHSHAKHCLASISGTASVFVVAGAWWVLLHAELFVEPA